MVKAQSDAEPNAVYQACAETARRANEKLDFLKSAARARAADRSGKPPAQPDAEPVAWRWRWRADPPNEWHFAVNEFHGEQIIIEPLYTTPPRPDASAGLIEAAEFAEQCANGSFSKNEAMYLRGFADRLRARAAERSGK